MPGPNTTSGGQTKRTYRAIVVDMPQGRLAVPWDCGDTAEDMERRFESRISQFASSVKTVMRNKFAERLKEFRRLGTMALDELFTEVEYED